MLSSTFLTFKAKWALRVLISCSLLMFCNLTSGIYSPKRMSLQSSPGQPYMSRRICCVMMMFVMRKGKEVFDLELFFRALADRTRLRIINLIGDQEVCVCVFVEILKTNQPKISRHLAYLRRAGIVATRREGIWMHYRLSTPKDENAARVLNEIREWLVKDPVMQQ